MKEGTMSLFRDIYRASMWIWALWGVYVVLSIVVAMARGMAWLAMRL